MNASCPAAGPLLPLQQFFTGSLDAAPARRWLLRVIDPADEFIPAEWREAFPQREDFWIRSHRDLKVFVCFVDRAVRKGVRHKNLQASLLDSRRHQAGFKLQLRSVRAEWRDVHDGSKGASDAGLRVICSLAVMGSV